MAEATVGLLRVVLSSNSAQFDSGMDKSSGKVDAFGRAGKSAAASLSRLVNDFNGARVTAEATKMATAIEKVGGVSKLTEADLSRVNRTLDNAIAKYRVMGTEVPPHISKLKNEVAALDKASGTAATGGIGKFSGALSMVGKLLPALGVATAVASLVRLGTAAMETADKHVTFADKLGVSTETTQRWAFVAGQTGTTMEAFGNSAFKLGINVSTGTEKVRKSVSDLGLAYVDLKNLKPEQQFDVVVKALEGVESATERNRIGQALFGKQFSEIAASVAAGYTKMKDDATISTDQQIRALEELGDKWERLKGRIAVAITGAMANLAADFTAAAASVDSLSDAERVAFIAATKLGEGHQFLIKLQHDRMAAMAETVTLQAHGAKATQDETSATTDYVAKLAEATAEVKGLTAAKKAQIDAAAKLGQITDEFADSIGVSREAISIYQSGLKDTTKGTRDYESATLKAAKANKDFADSIRAIPASNRTPFGNVFTVPRGVEDSSAEIGEIRESMDAMAGISFNQTWVPFVQGVTASSKEVEALRKQMATVAKWSQVGKTLAGAVVGAFQGGGDVGKALGGSAGSMIGNALGEVAGKAVGKAIGGAAGAAVGSVVPVVGTIIGGMLGSAIGSGIGKLFGGGSKEAKEVKAAQQDLITKMPELSKAAAAAGVSLGKLFSTKSMSEFKSELARVNTALVEHEAQLKLNTAAASTLFDDIMSAGSEGIPAAYRPAIEQLIALGLLTDEQAAKLRGMSDATGPGIAKMEAAMGTLKGRIESLGPAFRQAKINETAGTYLNAIQTLIDGGGDVGGILFDAREELGELVAESLRSKTTLPANLKPWIDDLVASGNLIDANGEKITDVSGLKFGEPMKTEAEKSKEGWDKIISAIDALIARINGPLTRSIENIPDRTIRVGVDVDDPDGLLKNGDDRYRSPSGNRDPGNAIGTMARFGKYFHDWGAGTRSALHGIEAVLTPKDAVPFSLATLGSMMPSLPAMPSLTPSFAGMGGTTNSTANNMIFVAIPVESAGDTYRITRDVMKALPSSIEMDESGVRSGIERVISDYTRTYGR